MLIVIVIHYGLRIINHLHFKNFFFKQIRFAFCCIKQKDCSILSILLSKLKSIYGCKWKKDTATNSNNLPREKWIHKNIILWEISIHENCFVYAWMMRMLCNLLPWKITTSENVGRKKSCVYYGEKICPFMFNVIKAWTKQLPCYLAIFK